MTVQAQALIQYPTIHEALAAKFSQPHYITMFEVRDSTGFDSTRSADALSIAMYGTRGREITGFEIKVSRSDWLRELKMPEKAEEIGKFCDWFYLVTNEESIAKLEEIPTPWGWMVLKGSRLKVVKKPEKMKPLPLDRPMLCSLLYSVRQQCVADIEKQIQAAVALRVKSEASGLKYQAEEWEKKFKALQKTVADFENASGVNIQSSWVDKPKIGAAVQRLMKQENVFTEYRRDLESICGRARAVVANIDRELAALDKEQQVQPEQKSLTEVRA